MPVVALMVEDGEATGEATSAWVARSAAVVAAMASLDRAVEGSPAMLRAAPLPVMAVIVALVAGQAVIST